MIYEIELRVSHGMVTINGKVIHSADPRPGNASSSQGIRDGRSLVTNCNYDDVEQITEEERAALVGSERSEEHRKAAESVKRVIVKMRAAKDKRTGYIRGGE